MNAEQLQAIKEHYSNMNWEDFRENAGDLLQSEIDIYDAVVIEGVPALIAEVEQLQKENQMYSKTILDSTFHDFQLKRENERLREALEEYAAKENYERVANDPDIYEGGYAQLTWEPSWVELDKGDLARKALDGEK